jgi:DNA-binding MarR family transcriptional regulator
LLDAIAQKPRSPLRTHFDSLTGSNSGNAASGGASKCRTIVALFVKPGPPWKTGASATRDIARNREAQGIVPNRIIRNRTDVKPETKNALAPLVAALHRTVHAMGLYFDREFDGEISQPEALALLILGARGESTINHIHRAFLHKRSTLTSVIDRLESKDFVERQIDERDRRNFVLNLTKTGRRAAERVLRALSKLERSTSISAKERNAAVETLDQIASAASSSAGTRPNR